MKLKILLVLCLVSNFVLAQLSVSGNNYIYATTSANAPDVYVFVEDDVNIENTNSYFYLRNDAQLLQGTGSTGNSGIGHLSVYQSGTVNNFAYNYWCSPVGNTDTDNNTNRVFRPNNNIYDVTSAPITSSLATYTSGLNGTSGPLVISSRWLYTFNPGITYSEWNYISDSGSVDAGYGFTMKGTTGGNQLYDFRGKPNNGIISTNVIAGEWTLVGNPYPSALDALDYIHDTQNQTSINGSLYYWEQDLSVNSHNIADYVGGYASYTITSDGVTETYLDAAFDTYNSDGSLNTTGGARTSSKTARRYIPIGQGFMVIGSANSTARTLNSHRQYYKQSDTDSEFFRIGNSKKEKKSNKSIDEIIYDDDGLQILPNEYKRFRLNIDFNDVYTRQILQNFHHTATDGFDYGLEIESPEGIDSDAYWVLNEKAYVAQAFNFDESLKIPLTVKVNSQNQLIRFRIFDVQNFNTNQAIYLYDIETDVYTDLTQGNHEISLEVGDYTNRFEITFTNNENIDIEIESDSLAVYQNNPDSQLTIINPNNLDIDDVVLYDVSGKLIFHHKDLDTRTKHEFSTQGLSSGIYLVSVKINKSAINKKVAISNK